MFTLQVIISFFVGGAFIALQTLLGERVPLYWRGTVLTLPSTMAVSFLFIGLTKSPDAIPEVAAFFPAATAISFIFVMAFTLLSRQKLPFTLLGAYLAWAICAWLIVSFPPHMFVTAVVLYALPIILACYFCIKHLPHHTDIKRVPFNLKHFTIRSIIGGSIVALAVILSKALGNTFGSLFSAFPANFSATLLIYAHVHGKKIIPAVAKSLFFPGPIALILYAGIASVTFPTFGVWYGTGICYLGVLAFYLLRLLVESKFVSKTVTPAQ